MHSLTTRAGRAAMAIVAVTAAAGVFALGAEPALADSPGAGTTHSGSTTSSGYSAAAAFVTATGGGSQSSDNSCTLEARDGVVAPGVDQVEGHYELHSYDNGDGTYDVFLDCIQNGHTGIPENVQFYWQVIEIYENVPAYEPEDLIEQALANMPVGSPDIRTSPGDGNPSMVGIDTWLMIDEGSFTRGERTDTQGPISVTVWAEPDRGGEVVWDTGEGQVVCTASDQDGACAHTYDRSSVEQAGRDGGGRPAYAITASVTYRGGYDVYVFGERVGGSANLGDITRTSEPYFLPVEDGQGLNTSG